MCAEALVRPAMKIKTEEESMIEFYQTRMGKTFYDHTMPTIAKELQRLNGLLERVAMAMEKQNAGQGAGEQQPNQEVDDGKA